VVGSTELPTLRSEGERLKLERDNAQLRAELAALGKPWWRQWRKGSVVTTLTAIIAAVVPVTTAVQAHYQKERELALEESKQAHAIRASYLDRLDKPGARLRTLRFVLATSNNPDLKEWAQAEKKEVQAELDGIYKQIDEIDQLVAAFSDNVNSPTSPTAAAPVGSASDDASQGKLAGLDSNNEFLRMSAAEQALVRQLLIRKQSLLHEANSGSHFYLPNFTSRMLKKANVP
jgi:hypothetical protein